MKRQVLILALLLVVLCPLAAGATDAAADPDGLTAPAPELADWFEHVLQVLRSWFPV